MALALGWGSPREMLSAQSIAAVLLAAEFHMENRQKNNWMAMCRFGKIER